MRRFILLTAVLGSLLALGVGPATAITDGQLDGNGHPTSA